VSRGSMQIAFLLVALNERNILETNIGNAYLNAEPREKVYTTAAPEFGAELQGRPVIIVWALYRLKSSGATWRVHLANTLASQGFTSCLADPNVCLRKNVKPDIFEYYECILVYVDNVLALTVFMAHNLL
jgi:hypothetical protein